MKPTISIIIIDKDELGIADTLNGLLKIARPAGTEVIVIDAADPSFFEGIRSHHPEANWIQFTPKSLAPGSRSVAGQRNAGIEAAKGDIIVFIDATCVPVKNWLVDLTAPILDGTESIVAGSVVSHDPKTHVNIQPPTMKRKYLSSCATINVAYKRSVFDQIGLFDESFQYGSDVDIAWRAIAAGYKIRFAPQAKVSHDWGDQSAEVKRMFKYGRAKAMLYAKHPDRMRPFADDVFLSVYVGYLLALPLTLIIPWYPLTILLLVAKNWRSQPVKTVALHLVFASGFIRQGASLLTNLPKKATPKSA